MILQKSRVFCVTCQKITCISNVIHILPIGSISGQYLKSKYCKDCRSGEKREQLSYYNPKLRG